MFFSGFQKLKLCVKFLISRYFFGIYVYKVDIAIARQVYQVRKWVRTRTTEYGYGYGTGTGNFSKSEYGNGTGTD